MERVYWTDQSSLPIEADLEPMFQDALGRGFQPFCYHDFCSAFGICNGQNRDVFFIRRGREPCLPRPLLEVLLTDADKHIRLGPRFGLEEHACVVVAGYDAAREVWETWLSDASIASVVVATRFFNRRGMSELQPVE